MKPEQNKSGSGRITISQVMDRVQNLEKAVVQLSEVREQVEVRLEAVLMPELPSPSTQRDKEKNSSVPLADELERLTDMLNGIRTDMESMLSRIEL